MSENEEIKTETKGCNCDKKELSRFLLVILGSFLGCLVALCLFSAVKKPQPPMPVMPMMPPEILREFDSKKKDCLTQTQNMSVLNTTGSGTT